MRNLTVDQIYEAFQIAFPRHDLHEESITFAREIEALVHKEISAVHDYPVCAIFRGGKCSCDAYESKPINSIITWQESLGLPKDARVTAYDKQGYAMQTEIDELRASLAEAKQAVPAEQQGKQEKEAIAYVRIKDGRAAGWTGAGLYKLPDGDHPLYTHPQRVKVEPLMETWIVVMEYVWKHDDGGRPTLAYLLPSEFGRVTYPSFEAASAFIKSGEWPLGWVAMKLDAPQAAHGIAQKEGE